MSLNHLTSLNDENKYFNIKCNSISLGGSTRIKTLAIPCAFTATNGNSIFSQSPLYYSSDYTSVTFKGYVVYNSSSTPQNNFTVSFLMPLELQSRFLYDGALTSSFGSVLENGANTNINSGSITNSQLVGNNINFDIYYRQDQSTVVAFRIYFDITVYKFDS